MTPRQVDALKDHCRLAFETAHPLRAYPVAGGSIVLSVNTGYE